MVAAISLPALSTKAGSLAAIATTLSTRGSVDDGPTGALAPGERAYAYTVTGQQGPWATIRKPYEARTTVLLLDEGSANRLGETAADPDRRSAFAKARPHRSQTELTITVRDGKEVREVVRFS